MYQILAQSVGICRVYIKKTFWCVFSVYSVDSFLDDGTCIHENHVDVCRTCTQKIAAYRQFVVRI